jgi:hypothetical protein
MVLTPMSDKEFEEALTKQKWTFAKTYAKTATHEYFLEDNNPDLFKELKRRLVELGKDGHFYATPQRYYYHGPYRYWRCDEVMNRDDRTLKYD